MSEPDIEEYWLARIRERLDVPYAKVLACDPVNAAMIRHWCEAHGITDPRYWAGDLAQDGRLLAPASMLQVWLQPGPSGWRPAGSATTDASEVINWFAEAGFSGQVGVGVEQAFHRPLTEGEQLYSIGTLTYLSELKTTGLGVGYFFTVRQDVYCAQEQVAQVSFRQLCYRPKEHA